jgi:hypothetical protein
VSLNLHLIGSFQRGTWLNTENPREEGWRRIAFFGTRGSLDRTVPDNSSLDWEQHKNYALVRIQQALEYRAATIGGSLLTRPVNLYYAVLGLVRAYFAVIPEIMPARHHGLRFTPKAELLDAEVVTVSGTFKELVESMGCSISSGTMFSLREILRRIVELAEDVTMTSCGPSLVVPVSVDARQSGEVKLRFHKGYLPDLDFREQWASEWPSLSSLSLSQEEYSIETTLSGQEEPYIRVCQFCEEFLIPDLKSSENPTWYSVRVGSGSEPLPRAAYYFAGLFVLANIARYEPEQLQEAVALGSEDGWLLASFLDRVDRYFPQLMLIWGRGGKSLYL